MLANRLNVLLAERQLTNKQVVNDTGISRNTISNISNNPTANISTDTIDRLCRYLGVTPTDFFAYSEYEIEFIASKTSPAIQVNIYYHENFDSIGFLATVGNSNDLKNKGISTPSHKYDFQMSVRSYTDFEHGDKRLADIYTSLPAVFQANISNRLFTTIEQLFAYERLQKRGDRANIIKFENCEGAVVRVLLLLPWGKLLKSFDTSLLKFM